MATKTKTKIIPFDPARIHEGIVKTKNGQRIRILCIDGPKRFPVIGIPHGEDEAMPDSWKLDGGYLFTDCGDSMDLVIEIPAQEYWVNLYRNSHGAVCTGGMIYTLIDAALANRGDNCIGTCKLDYES